VLLAVITTRGTPYRRPGGGKGPYPRSPAAGVEHDVVVRCGGWGLRPNLGHMLIDLSYLAARSEYHRAELLADAEVFRLARLARRANRRRRRATPASGPPQETPTADRHELTPATGDDASERRYAVPR
jgi:hypothetical protein